MVKVIYLFFITFLLTVKVQAQCPIENTFFESGEEISYDLYFKYGLLNTKAGVSSLKTSEVAYNGVPAYKMTLLAKSNGVINKIFTLSDTLTCYMSKDLIPLAYIKNAHEGAEHTVSIRSRPYFFASFLRFFQKTFQKLVKHSETVWSF